MAKTRFKILVRNLKGEFARVKKGTVRSVTIYDTENNEKVSFNFTSDSKTFKNKIKKNPAKFFRQKTIYGVPLESSEYFSRRFKSRKVEEYEIRRDEQQSRLNADNYFLDFFVLGIDFEAVFGIFKSEREKYQDEIDYYYFGVVGTDKTGNVIYAKYTPRLGDLTDKLFIRAWKELEDRLGVSELQYKVNFETHLRIVL